MKNFSDIRKPITEDFELAMRVAKRYARPSNPQVLAYHKDTKTWHSIDKHQFDSLTHTKHEYEVHSIHEAVDNSEGKDPPPVVLMKRKSIRQFPDGKRVALYYADKLNKYISIPYTAGDKGDKDEVVAEEVIIQEGTPKHSIFARLKKICDDGRNERIRFANGTTCSVDQFTARKVLALYDAMGEESRKKLSKMAVVDKAKFSKIVDFAHRTLSTKG